MAFLAGAVTALLWVGASAQPGPATASESHLNVVYAPPRLSVDARSVELPAILREIGAKVGFTVVDDGSARPALTISLKGAPLEVVLRELLRSENHVLLYREPGAGTQARRLATIMLLGVPAPAARGASARDPRQVRGWNAESVRTGGEPASPLDSPTTGQAADVLAGASGWVREAGLDPGEPDPPVGRILRVHAFQGLPRLSDDLPLKPPAAKMNSPLERSAPRAGGLSRTQALPDAEEALAVTTRLARQNLQALIEGLATATNSLAR